MMETIQEVLDFYAGAGADKQKGVTVPLDELRALWAEVEGYRAKDVLRTVMVTLGERIAQMERERLP